MVYNAIHCSHIEWKILSKPTTKDNKYKLIYMVWIDFGMGLLYSISKPTVLSSFIKIKTKIVLFFP